MMLKGVDPVLTPEVLFALAETGHGDEVVLCDAHFPGLSVARSTAYGKLLRLDAADSGRAARAVLSVLELDAAVADPASRMQVGEEPGTIPAVQREVQQEVDAALGETRPMTAIPRLDFYERARGAFCVILTGELRGWGDFLFVTGVSPAPDAPPLVD